MSELHKTRLTEQLIIIVELFCRSGSEILSLRSTCRISSPPGWDAYLEWVDRDTQFVRAPDRFSFDIPVCLER